MTDGSNLDINEISYNFDQDLNDFSDRDRMNPIKNEDLPIRPLC